MKKHLSAFFLITMLVLCLAVILVGCEDEVTEPTSFNIKYELDGGKLPSGAPKSYEEGSLPNFTKIVPTKENYKFGGWYTDSKLENKVTASTALTGEVKLYAKWTPKTFYISYILSGGECDNLPIEYTFGETLSLAELTPAKEGFLFMGWFTDELFTEECTEIEAGASGDLTFYAKWESAPIKLAEIPDVTKGYFGTGYSSVEIDLSKYIDTNDNSLSCSASSSDTSVASVAISGKRLTINFLKGSGASEITLDVFTESGAKALSFKFDATPKTYTKIACVGDSLTEKQPAYPYFLNNYIGNSVTIENYGKSGVSLTQYTNNPSFGQYKVFAYDKYAASLNSDAELIIIMLGTNDATKVSGGTPVHSWTQVRPAYKSDYLELINAYKTANPTAEIVIMTSPEVLDGNELSISNELLKENIYPLQLEIAKEAGVKLLDLRAYIAALQNKESLYLDGIHFNENGAKKIAEFVAKNI